MLEARGAEAHEAEEGEEEEEGEEHEAPEPPKRRRSVYDNAHVPETLRARMCSDAWAAPQYLKCSKRAQENKLQFWSSGFRFDDESMALPTRFNAQWRTGT